MTGDVLCVLMRERREQRRAGQRTEDIANDLGCAFELWELSTGVDCLNLPAVQPVPNQYIGRRDSVHKELRLAQQPTCARRVFCRGASRFRGMAKRIRM